MTVSESEPGVLPAVRNSPKCLRRVSAAPSSVGLLITEAALVPASCRVTQPQGKKKQNRKTTVVYGSLPQPDKNPPCCFDLSHVRPEDVWLRRLFFNGREGREGGARLCLFITPFAAEPEGPAGKLTVDVEESIKRIKKVGFWCHREREMMPETQLGNSLVELLTVVTSKSVP